MMQPLNTSRNRTRNTIVPALIRNNQIVYMSNILKFIDEEKHHPRNGHTVSCLLCIEKILCIYFIFREAITMKYYFISSVRYIIITNVILLKTVLEFVKQL